MNYSVNDNCIGCGLCAEICPEVFEMDGGKSTVIKTEMGVQEEACADEAMESCPVDAIEKEN